MFPFVHPECFVHKIILPNPNNIFVPMNCGFESMADN
jgi:hypothetical protein